MDVDESLAISIIEHIAYCPRQAALIHVEGVWEANIHTAQGEADHASVDRATKKVTRDGLVTWSSLPVWSETLGIYGVCDVVEIRDGVCTPIEFKPRIPPWLEAPAELQLCAQAMCLEDMWSANIEEGILFTRKDKRRHSVKLTESLRKKTVEAIGNAKSLLMSRALPDVVNDKRCDMCSLINACRGGVSEFEMQHVSSRELFIIQQEGNW